jgi:DNA repair protein RadD
MAVQLRPYQIEAVNACAKALRDKPTALIVMGTGAGKALTLASVCKRVLERNPSWRVLVLCYIQEVLESNQHACDQLGVDSGIYCAGAGKRDVHHSVIHASRDSLAANLDQCGTFQVLIVDECHTIGDFQKSEKQKTRYQKIVEHYAPKYLIGLTATPFRMDGGYIYGRRKLFNSVCFDLGMDKLIEQGFLVPFVFPTLVDKQFDTSGIKITNGDYDTKQLEEKLLRDEKLVSKTMDVWLDKAQGRKVSLFFCHSVAHAQMCMKVFKEKFPWIPCAYLDGETKKTERKKLVEDAKAGEFSAIFQINTMTTGTNIPIIDCIVWLRPTLSPVLYVQGNGRGARLYPDKQSCLVIDTVGNIETFGSITRPTIVATGKAKKMEFSPEELKAMGLDPTDIKGAAPTKKCKSKTCGEIIHAAAKKCDVCGQLQISDVKLFGSGSGKDEVDYELKSVSLCYTKTQKGDKCLKVTYYTETSKQFYEWIREDQIWNKAKIMQRLSLRQNGVTHLKVKHNHKNPTFPILTAYLNQDSKKSSSLVYANLVSSVGETTQSVFTTKESEAIEA